MGGETIIFRVAPPNPGTEPLSFKTGGVQSLVLKLRGFRRVKPLKTILEKLLFLFVVGTNRVAPTKWLRSVSKKGCAVGGGLQQHVD